MKKPYTLLFILLLFSLTISDSKSITILQGHVATPIIYELVQNGGFEIVGTGVFPEVSDDDGLLAGWYEIEGAGTLIRTVAAGEFHSGSAALKMTTGIAAPNTHVYDAFVVVPGGTYRYEIWVRSEAVGGVEGRWCIYDWINWAYITVPAGLHGTGVTDSAWTLITGTFVAPAGCTLAGVYLYCPLTIGKIVWFDDVSVKQVVE
jgi:hypothetical protein